MKKVLCILLLLSSFYICTLSFAEDKQELTVREGHFDTTSKEITGKYQNVNAAVLASSMSPAEFPGPHAGPGFYMGMNGPLVAIAWLEKNNTKVKTRAKRYIPLSSVLSTDQPLQFEKGPERYVIYYKGPFGETEFFILVNLKGEKGENSEYEKFLSRWKLYLVAQEPVR